MSIVCIEGQEQMPGYTIYPGYEDDDHVDYYGDSSDAEERRKLYEDFETLSGYVSEDEFSDVRQDLTIWMSKDTPIKEIRTRVRKLIEAHKYSKNSVSAHCIQNLHRAKVRTTSEISKSSMVEACMDMMEMECAK